MGAMASQITSLTIVYSTVYSGADQRKYQSSPSLAFARGIHQSPLNSPPKGPVTRKMFPFDDVIMDWYKRPLDLCGAGGFPFGNCGLWKTKAALELTQTYICVRKWYYRNGIFLNDSFYKYMSMSLRSKSLSAAHGHKITPPVESPLKGSVMRSYVFFVVSPNKLLNK